MRSKAVVQAKDPPVSNIRAVINSAAINILEYPKGELALGMPSQKT